MKKDKLKNLTYEELFNLYITENKTAKEIAGIFNVDISSIFNKLKKFGIEKPKSLRKINQKQNIIAFYQDEKRKNKKVKKAQQTNLERYGSKNALGNEQIRRKMQQTCMKRYGVSTYSKTPEYIEKCKETNNQRYGCDFGLQNEEIKEKGRQTCLRKYGQTRAIKTEETKQKFKQTCLERYGVDNVSKHPKIVEKIKQTTFDHFGCWNLQKKEIRDLCQSQESWKKRYETMKENNSFYKSKLEEQVFELLKTKFKVVERQYHCSKYNFPCDFYLPEIDIFIEIQGHVCHGGRPYLGTEEDLKQVQIWKQKANGNLNSNYLKFIETWTKRDVLKREIAKRNNLNWIEFFTLNEFLIWWENY